VEIPATTIAEQPATTAPPAPAPPPPVASDTPPTPPAPEVVPGAASAGDAAPTAVAALDVVDDFRRAYEQRDVTRVGRLFTADARKGELVGRDAILADYQRFFSNARNLLYTQPSAAVEPHAGHVVVRAPFEITYTDSTGRDVEVRGTAAWTIVRRDGNALIRDLTFEVIPLAAPGR
jgi:hypothetical protein